jgi:HD-GYP domain-containing protein (c-di-GMP phosphodiesterase class II)
MINEKKICKEFNSDEVLELIFIYLTEVSSSRDYDDVIITLADMGRILTNADRCSVWVVDEAKKTIWTKVAHGIDEIEMPMFQGIVGHAIKSGSRVLVDDAYKDERFNQSIDEKTGYLTESMMVVPMHDKDEKIIGAFQVINNRGVRGTFNQDEMNRLMLTSTFAAETLISAKLTHEIEETQKEVVLTMGAVAESRSKETGNHVKRVAKYSKILALAYGLSEEEAELLRQASPMHDIGKIAIADSILNKPGKFTHHEYEIMKQHAQLGYEMIKGSKRALLKAASIVAHEHHEKFDGSGYPRGLRGDDIHIYGRITAIADVFDALGSDRVYKKAWSDEKIFTLFKEESGKHFDPALIELFFNNLDGILAVRESLRDDCNFESGGEFLHIKALGAYGSRSKEHGSSSFLLDQANAIDAGNLINSIGTECAELKTSG